MEPFVEVAEQDDGLAQAIKASRKTVTGLNGEVRLLVPNALPNDGKVIDDRRQND